MTHQIDLQYVFDIANFRLIDTYYFYDTIQDLVGR
jgi:hypothetical protein